MTHSITTEPSHKYQVQERYTKAPPAPYRNDWRLAYSFNEVYDALVCMSEVSDSFNEARTLGVCTDPAHFYVGHEIEITDSFMIGCTRLFRVRLAHNNSISFLLPREFTA